MRFRQIILAYFVIGSFMYGAGVVDWTDAGIAQVFVENNAQGVQPNDETTEELQGAGGAITSLVDAFGGPLILIWDLINGLLGFIHWPVVALHTNNAPPRITMLLGGGFVVGFYMSLVGLVRSSS